MCLESSGALTHFTVQMKIDRSLFDSIMTIFDINTVDQVVSGRYCTQASFSEKPKVLFGYFKLKESLLSLYETPV